MVQEFDCPYHCLTLQVVEGRDSCVKEDNDAKVEMFWFFSFNSFSQI
jgi:hypothetical protein